MVNAETIERKVVALFFPDVSLESETDKLNFRVPSASLLVGVCMIIVGVRSLIEAQDLPSQIQAASDGFLDSLTPKQKEEWISNEKSRGLTLPEELIADLTTRRYREARIEYINEHSDFAYDRQENLRLPSLLSLPGLALTVFGGFFFPRSQRRNK